MQHRPGEARPEWVKQPPAEWERRLREISPVTARTSHLRFRWSNTDECWLLYQCMPAQMLPAERVQQLSVHWSALPKAEQMGRRRMVSDYQFWMFRTHRVDATTFWCLQGSTYLVGGTPASFTDRERRLMEAQGMDGEPIPFGMLPNIPFDERVVQAIQARDKLLKVGGDLDALLKENRPDYQIAADEAAEREYRKTFLAWNNAQNAPIHEFLKWSRGREQFNAGLAPAPDGLLDDLAVAKDTFLETGHTYAGMAGQRKIQIAVR